MARRKKTRGGRVTPKGGGSGKARQSPKSARSAGLTGLEPASGVGRTNATGATLTADRGTVKQGVIGLSRTVPPEIERPPYAETGDPGPPSRQDMQSPETIEAMRRTGALAAETLIKAGEVIRPGITTDEIDEVVHTAAIEAGAYPSPLNYKGFRKSVCTSVNEVICHGIPDSRRLEQGEIVNIDVTVFREGVHGDTNATFKVGEVDEESRHLIDTTRECLYRAIDMVKPGRPINVIGRAIQEHAEAQGLGVVREFIGHGVGPTFHTALQIPHYYEPMATTMIEEAMTFTIEPMITIGDPALMVWNDGWTAVTLSGLPSAQFEHTLVVHADGAEILTRADAIEAPGIPGSSLPTTDSTAANLFP